MCTTDDLPHKSIPWNINILNNTPIILPFVHWNAPPWVSQVKYWNTLLHQITWTDRERRREGSVHGECFLWRFLHLCETIHPQWVQHYPRRVNLCTDCAPWLDDLSLNQPHARKCVMSPQPRHSSLPTHSQMSLKPPHSYMSLSSAWEGAITFSQNVDLTPCFYLILQYQQGMSTTQQKWGDIYLSRVHMQVRGMKVAWLCHCC